MSFSVVCPDGDTHMPRTDAEIKAMLTTIMDNDYSIGEGQDYFAMAKVMLEHLGSPDSELRDDLIYDILAHWIDGDRLDAGQMRQLLHTCLGSSHLCYRIGESEDDSVFTRSFSALVIALIIDAHRRHAFLTDSELRLVKRHAVAYMRDEKDVRGYVDGKGWAHSAAHGADVLNEVAQCPEISDPADMRELLAAIKARVETDYYAYIHEEDERLASVVVSIMGRKILDDREIVQWLDSFPATRRIVIYPGDLYLRANVKSFFRSLYLRLSKADGSSPVLAPLGEMQGRHSRF